MQARIAPTRVGVARSLSCRRGLCPRRDLPRNLAAQPQRCFRRHPQINQGFQPPRCSKVEDAPAGSQTTDAPELPPSSVLDIRVGKVLSCEVHPEAESLYIESIDVGEEDPRTVVSGLVSYVPVEELQDRKVLVICNLKPSSLRGVKSTGMILCASDKEEADVVEPLDVPEGAVVGERVYFGDNSDQDAPDGANRMKKKKFWSTLQPLLKTNDARVVELNGQPMNTSAGPVTAKTLGNASIS